MFFNLIMCCFVLYRNKIQQEKMNNSLKKKKSMIKIVGILKRFFNEKKNSNMNFPH